MNLFLLDKTNRDNSCISVARYLSPHFLKKQHYHHKIELVNIIQSEGVLLSGNAATPFGKNDIFLIGHNIPHMWVNNDDYFLKKTNLVAESIGIHFDKSIFGKPLYKSEEMQKIRALLKRSKKILKFSRMSRQISSKIEKILSTSGVQKFSLFLEVLEILSKSEHSTVSPDVDSSDAFFPHRNKRIEQAIQYVTDHFNDKIILSKVAEIAAMNATSFSRLFKTIYQKPFSRYLNEVRVQRSKKMLVENKLSITEICFESGFRNISNFNRQFKSITGKTPRQFRNFFNKAGLTTK